MEQEGRNMSDLIDRQAAIDAIMASTSKYTGFMEMEMYTDDDAVEAIEAVPAASPWHRVEDELPDDTIDVLAVRRYGNDLEKQEVIVAHLSVIMDMKRGFDKWCNATNITHWMPFPEPPKEDA